MATQLQFGDVWHTLVEQVVVAAGLELVQAEWRGEGGTRVLRVTIDQPAGVGLAECERVSHALSTAFDAIGDGAEGGGGLPAGGYTLEVSSPGLNRPLLKPADFVRFAGQRAQLRARLPGGPRSWTGQLQGAGTDGVHLHSDSGEDVVVAWDCLERARLAPAWPQPRRPGKRS